MVEYQPGTTFPGPMGRTIGESEPAWPAPLRAKAGAPNVLFIVLDATGFRPARLLQLAHPDPEPSHDPGHQEETKAFARAAMARQ